MKRKILRTLEQVIYDHLWPSQGLSPDPAASLRHRAIVNILVRLPADAYVNLTEKADEFSWFVPDMIHGGMVMPFRYTMPRRRTRVAMAKVLYLSPGLERRSFDVAVASIAHELAHIFLN